MYLTGFIIIIHLYSRDNKIKLRQYHMQEDNDFSAFIYYKKAFFTGVSVSVMFITSKFRY